MLSTRPALASALARALCRPEPQTLPQRLHKTPGQSRMTAVYASTSLSPSPEPHADRRHADPEHGGLSSGEKSAVTKELHGQATVHFTEQHPELKKAAAEYRQQVEAKEKGPQAVPTAEKKKGRSASPNQGSARELKQGHKHEVGELSTGEKAAISRAIHEGRDVATLPFVQEHVGKVVHAQEYAKQVVEGKKGGDKMEEGNNH